MTSVGKNVIHKYLKCKYKNCDVRMRVCMHTVCVYYYARKYCALCRMLCVFCVVCVYVCKFILSMWVFIFTRVNNYVSDFEFMSAYIWACKCLHEYVLYICVQHTGMYNQVFVSVYVCVYECVCVRVCACVCVQ